MNLCFEDLELDLLFEPDGSQKLLDQEEFYSLDLDQQTRNRALEGLDQVSSYFRQKMES